MGWPACNATLEDQPVSGETPIWKEYTFHDIGLLVSAGSGGVAIIISFFLIYMHTTHYLKPWEQKHIIRILLMVPIYAAVSFLSYYYYVHTVYFEVIEECYEAFAIASFFALLCHYLAQDLHSQKIYFRTISPRKWIWPIPWVQKCWGGENGVWRTPRSGLTWFNVIWVGVFQYCFIRVFMTIVAVITESFGRYCLESLSPAFSHVWITCIEAVSVSIAMYCLIQFYVQIRLDIKQHKPILKIAAIKLVIFLSFWQQLLISFLTSTGAIKATHKIMTPDIKVGIPAMLLDIEMAIFSIFHLFAFSWKPYTRGSKNYLAESVPGESSNGLEYVGGFMGIHALIDAFNFWDLIKAVGRSAKWLFVGRKHRMEDESYLSHPNTNSSSFGHDEDGQKLSNLNNGPTAYTGARLSTGKAPQYQGAVDPAEGQGLLGYAQPMPVSRPGTTERIEHSHYHRNDVSPYRDSVRHGGDIGVANSSYDDMEARERAQEEEGQQYGYPQRPPTYQTNQGEVPGSRLGSRGVGASFAERADEERRGRGAPGPDELSIFDQPPQIVSTDRRSTKAALS